MTDSFVQVLSNFSIHSKFKSSFIIGPINKKIILWIDTFSFQKVIFGYSCRKNGPINHLSLLHSCSNNKTRQILISNDSCCTQYVYIYIYIKRAICLLIRFSMIFPRLFSLIHFFVFFSHLYRPSECYFVYVYRL